MNIEHSMSQNDKRGGGTGIRRLPTAFMLGALLLVQSGAQAQATSPGASGMVDPLVGAWNVLVNIYDCNSGDVIFANSQSLALFNADGTRHETNATNPALRSPGFGHWNRIGKREYTFEFKYYRFSATGQHIGSTIVWQDVVLSDDGLSYYSDGQGEFRNTTDDLLFVSCANATATRFE